MNNNEQNPSGDSNVCPRCAANGIHSALSEDELEESYEDELGYHGSQISNWLICEICGYEQQLFNEPDYDEPED